MYKIGMFASMNRVTIKALRYYDEQKLLVPVYVDDENGYRYYKAGQMAQVECYLTKDSLNLSSLVFILITNTQPRIIRVHMLLCLKNRMPLVRIK